MARILIVEDEWLIATDHAEALAARGHEVMGPMRMVAEALERLAAEQPEAALLDIRLDGETTFALATQLQRRGIPFAFVTGLVESDVPERFRDVPLLAKPVPPGLLVAEVDRLLGVTGGGPSHAAQP